MITHERKGICGICSAGCWIVAGYNEDGKIAAIRADDDGHDMGIICPLGEHSPEIIYSENRLLHPLKRKGPKGTFDFERISWADAYGIIVDDLNAVKSRYGPEAAAIYTGVGSFELALCDVFQPAGVAVSSASSVLFPYGSPNTMGVGALCYVSYGMIAPHVTCGGMLINMFNDIENSEMIVVWGTNPATDCPPVEMKRILEAKARGAAVIVIDPRRTATAALSDAEWVPIRPGTDGALALGMCRVVIEEELYDEKFVRDWTVGFEDFARYVQHFRPEIVEHITGVPAGRVVSLARDICAARGVSQLMYTGMEYSHSGVQGIRATLVLWALAGQLDMPGGRCFSMPSSRFPINREGLVKNPVTDTRLGRDKFPVYIHYRDEAHASALPRSVLEGKPYTIHSLIILGGSIITSWPNPALWKKTLEGLDHLVCIDRQLTQDAAYADIVLPAATYYETQSYMVYGPLFRIREKMIEPLGEARGDVFILAELAHHLGYGHLYPQTEEELLEYVLKGSGFTPDDVRASGGTASVETKMFEYRKWEKGLLRTDGKPGFDTPTGKFEIASSVLGEFGYHPLPVYTEPKEGPLSSPDIFDDFPLVFNSGSRVRTAFHTQHIGVKAFSRARPEPAVTMNTADADERGINDGDKVLITTRRGEVAMRARITDDIARGFVDADHGCGGPVGPEAWQACNINELTDIGQYDPISGFPVYKSLLCQIKKIGDGSTRVSSHSEERSDACVIPERTIFLEPVYLDHNATTPLAPEVMAQMVKAMDYYGNPSSIHEAGRRSRDIVDEARRAVAAGIGSTARRVIFTGNGSEANNLAIKGAAFARKNGANHLITSRIEHPSVLNAFKWLADRGFTVTFLDADENGIVRPHDLERAITSHTFLVSIMAANNETGSLQYIQDLAAIAHRRGAWFHSDATQAFGKIPVHVDEWAVDMLTLSSHKVYGPKGIGGLYVRRGVELADLISGGGQEMGLRSGTENTIGIAGFGKAAEMVPGFLVAMKDISGLRDRLEQGIRGIIPGSRLNGHREMRLPNTLNMTLPGLRGESLVTSMSRYGVYFSSGSACASGSPEPSHALLAMGMSPADAHCSLRFSLGQNNTHAEIDRVISLIKKIIEDSKKMVSFVPCR